MALKGRFGQSSGETFRLKLCIRDYARLGPGPLETSLRMLTVLSHCLGEAVDVLPPRGKGFWGLPLEMPVTFLEQWV